MSTRQAPIPVRPVFPEARQSLARAAFASALALSSRHRDGAAGHLEQRFPGDEVAKAFLERAVVGAASTSTPSWAGILAASAPAAFVESLQPESAASPLFAKSVSVTVPPGARTITIPGRTSGPIAYAWTDENAPIPVTSWTFAAATLKPGKIGIIVVLSKELSRLSNAFEIFEQCLKEDAARSLDSAVFGDDAATSEHPAGLLAGLTPITATAAGGSARDVMLADLSNLASAVGTGGSGEVAFIMEAGRAAFARALAPELKSSILASGALPADRVIGVDPKSLATSVGEVLIDRADSATLHMSDVPLPIASVGTPNTVAAPTQSMFQAATIAVRLLITIGFVPRRAGAVAFVDAVNW